MDLGQRTAAVIHLDRLRRNIENVKARLAPGTEIMAVLKADAYGHGMTGIYPTMRQYGVESYAVAVLEEGVELRQAGAEEPILILGDTRDEQLDQLIQWKLMPPIFDVQTAAKLNELARQAGVVHPIHIKIDTGMNRLGFPADDRAVEAMAAIAAMENLTIAGAFTHYAKGDDLTGQPVREQMAKFMAVIDAARGRGIEIPMLHTANSPATLLWPETHLDAVRAGDLYLGINPVDEATWAGQGFEEVLTWHSYVAFVKTVPAGSPVSYGGTYVTERETVLASVPVGFADGYARRLSNRGWVTIHGQDAPIRGRVCMDQILVDVTDIPGVKRGDSVTLLGASMTIFRMAEMLDCTLDEVTCGLTHRVPRLYVDGEDII